MNSFYPDAVKCWNDIGPEQRQTDKISTFKTTLVRMVVPEEKSIFNIRSQDLRYLYQLRVGLSPLKAHKRRHNFLDTPDDTCTCHLGVETTAHFLLHCPFFNAQREELMASIQPILNEFTQIDNDLTMSSFLMYGSKTLNPLQNKEILNATLTIICSTGRFSRETNS